MKTFKSPSGGKKLAMRVTVAALTSACAVAPAPQMEDELRSLSSALLPSVGAFPSLSAEDGLVGDGFGVVAIDTDTLAIGSPGADIDGLRDHGAVYIYQRDQTSGWKQIQKLISPTRQSGDQFGKSLAVRGDVLAVGAPTEDAPGISDQGVVHVFRRNQDGTNTWTLSGSLTNDVGSFGYFGTDLAIDDNVILIGAPGAHGQEGAVVLRDVSFDFANLGELRNSAGRSGEHFGHALALAGDTLAIGAPGGYEIHGSVFVFQRLPDVTNAWSEATRIIDGSGEANAQFGEGMALDGQTLLVSTQSVSVRIYERDRGAPNAWGLHTILSPDAADAYGFAYDGAVALRGDEAWVGSPSASGNGFTGQGIVYHYWHDRQNGDQWREAPHLTAPDGLPHDSFGAHVDVNATSLVVGATGAQGKGRAYILDTSVSLSNSATCVSLANCAVPTTALLTPGSSITTASGALLGAGEESLERPMPA
ncbi:MAG TPA: hypothetical protein VNN80_13585, partial [Polyangiaceae bacterium]|nr:hypothetical protein [Polyangiaceae bacterium]